MAQVMLLGPDRRRAGNLRGLLRQDGHEVTWVLGLEAWTAAESELAPDLIVAAVDSTEYVLAHRRGELLEEFPTPMLFVPGRAVPEVDLHVDERLVDRLSPPFLEEELLARVDALVRVSREIRDEPLTPDARRAAVETSAPAKVRRVGRRLDTWLHGRVPRLSKPLDPYLEVAKRVAQWADRRDAYEPGHAERVTAFCAMIAEGLDLDDHETAAVLRGAMLHDIGKVALPVEMLHQRAPLHENQMRMIHAHPRRGAALVRALQRDDEVADAILFHHERPDGFGYYAVAEQGIPRAARVIAVAEVYDGMTSTRLKQPLSVKKALRRLSAFKGSSVDGDCVEALVDRLAPRSKRVTLAVPTRG